MSKNMATCGVYLTKSEAFNAIGLLTAIGFRNSDIAVVSPDKEGHHDFVYGQQTNLKDGAMIGAIAGIFLFGIAGFFIGMNSPNTSSFPTWILTTITGFFVGSTLGAACGALVGIGTPKTAEKRYGFYLKEGGVLVAVHVNSAQENLKASQALETTGAQDITVIEEKQILKKIIPEERKLQFV